MNDNVQSRQGDAAVCGISGFVLKMIAVITMLIDHTAATILERALWGELTIGCITEKNMQMWTGVYYLMRIIGRMAFPIYCFLLVEGFTYTRNRGKYALRLFLFALISEVPFDLAFQKKWWDTSYNNVFFTLLLGLLAIMALDWVRRKWKKVDESASKRYWFFSNLAKSIVLATITLGTMAIADLVLHTDYGASGVAAIIVMYLLYKNRMLAFGIMVLVLTLLSSSLEIFALFMLIPLHFYNGTRGKQVKYAFYAFYPVHLLVLVGICYLIKGVFIAL